MKQLSVHLYSTVALIDFHLVNMVNLHTLSLCIVTRITAAWDIQCDVLLKLTLHWSNMDCPPLQTVELLVPSLQPLALL